MIYIVDRLVILSKFRRAISFFSLFFIILNNSYSQSSFQINTTGSITQNFDSYFPITGNITWIDTVTIPYWYFERSTFYPKIIYADDGSSTFNNRAFSYGSVGSSDRAFGSVETVPPGPYAHVAWGIQFKNNTLFKVSEFNVSYKGEQWRNSGNSNQSVSFCYRVSPTRIDTLNPNQLSAPWNPYGPLKFYSPVYNGTPGPLDGNVIAQHLPATPGSIPSLALDPGNYIMFKWDNTDFNNADHGMAIDDVVISWTVCSTPTLQSSNISSSIASLTSLNISWNNGDGSGRYVVINTTNSFNNLPIDGTTPTVNSAYSGGEQGVYLGTGNTVTVTGLTPCTIYYVRVYEYNCTGANSKYNTTTSAGNPASVSTDMSNQPLAYNLTGNNSYCEGTSGVAVGLSNSQTGVNYQLYLDCPVPNTPVGSPIGGFTGSPISFGNQTIPSAGPCTFSVIGTSATYATCTASMSNTLTVSISPTPVFTITSTNPTTCLGSDGTITLNGLTANTTYSVSFTYNSTPATPQTLTSNATGSITLTGLIAGNYTAITVTLNSCPSAPAAVTLADPPIPAAPTIGASATTICSGQSTLLSCNDCSGTVTWSTGASTSVITVFPTVTTTYTATCTVAGCVSSASTPLTITVNPSPVVTAANTVNPTSCGGSDGSITLTGLQASTLYQVDYLYNGTAVGPLSITTNAAGELTIANLASGSYTNIIVTFGGCPSAAVSANLFDPGAPTAPSVSATLSTICEGQSTDLTATGCAGTVTWSNGSTSATTTVTPTVTTTYTATCTVAGCTSVASSPLTITVNASPVVTSLAAHNPTTCGGDDGSIDLDVTTPNTTYVVNYIFNGTPASTQNISSSASGIVTISGLSAGNYTGITLTLNGCPSAAQTATLADPSATAAPTVTTSAGSVCIGQSAVLTASGCSGTLLWSTGETSTAITVSPVSTTTYTVTCTVNNCVSPPGNVTINIDPGPVVGSITPSSPSVCGGNDGSLTLNSLLPSTSYIVSYLYNGNPVTVTLSSNASGSLVISGLSAGSYTSITLTLAGCSSVSYSANIADPGSPAAPTVTAGGATTICQGETVSLTASGCSGNIAWSSGETTPTIIVSPAATTTYTATCTVGGCTSTASNAVTVTVNPSPIVVSVDTNGAVNGLANGSVVVTAAGTGLDYSLDGIAWQPTGTFNNLLPGSYTLQVRGSNGCITQVPFVISNLSVTVVSLQADMVTICPGNTVSISVYPTGMANVKSFSLCLTYDPLIASFAGITNANPLLSNVLTDSFVPGHLVITWSGTAAVTIPDADLLFRLRFLGIQSGSSPVDWNNFAPGVCGIYDNLGNAYMVNFTAGAANFLPAPDAAITGDTEVCQGEPITLTAAGDTLIHIWTTPDGTIFNGQQYIVPVSGLSDGGEYRLISTGSNGCSDADTANVIVNAGPQISLAAYDSICAEGVSDLTPGEGYDTYLWQDGSTLPFFTTTGEGVYWVQVTDGSGCPGYDTVTLVKCPAAFLVPTAFSPNGDGKNDVFRVQFSTNDIIENYKLLIYDRWGQVVFESSNIGDTWNGYINGNPCPSGVYAYVIRFSKPEGKSMSQKSPCLGSFVLIR